MRAVLHRPRFRPLRVFFASDSRRLSWGCQRFPPSTSRFARPLPALHHPKMAAATNRSVERLRPEVATLQTRSVLAVPPGSDGFLRASSCRFVAPCSRPWGSPSFWPHLLSFRCRSILTRGPGLLTQSRPFSSVHTLRSVPPAGSRIVSPRPVPSRRCFCSCSVSLATAQARPQGLAPPEGPLHFTPLPVFGARCSHGLSPQDSSRFRSRITAGRFFRARYPLGEQALRASSFHSLPTRRMLARRPAPVVWRSEFIERMRGRDPVLRPAARRTLSWRPPACRLSPMRIGLRRNATAHPKMSREP